MTGADQERERALLEVAEEVVRLRAALDLAQKRFFELSRQVGTGTASTAGRSENHVTAQSAVSGDLSAAQRVLAVFRRQPNKVVALQSVVEEVTHDRSDVTAELVRTAAARFARNAKGKAHGLRKAGRGKYRYIPAPEEVDL